MNSVKRLYLSRMPPVNLYLMTDEFADPSLSQAIISLSSSFGFAYPKHYLSSEVIIACRSGTFMVPPEAFI